MAISKLQPLIRAPSSTQVLYGTFMPQPGFIVFSQFCKIQSCKHTGWEEFKHEHQEGDQDTELVFL